MSDIKNLVINNESYNIVDDEAVHFSSSQNLTNAEKEIARANINAAKPITYSTGEVLTGNIWIDGKPIYRRVFTGTASSSTNPATLGTIEDLATVVSIDGSCYATTKGIFFPPNWYYNSTNRVDVYVDNLSNVVARSSFASVECKIIVEYTKNEITSE